MSDRSISRRLSRGAPLQRSAIDGQETHASPRLAGVPLQLVLLDDAGKRDPHRRPLVDVLLAGHVIARDTVLPLREAAAALTLDRWDTRSPVEVYDAQTGSLLASGTINALGSYCSVAECIEEERREVRRHGVRDPRRDAPAHHGLRRRTMADVSPEAAA